MSSLNLQDFSESGIKAQKINGRALKVLGKKKKWDVLGFSLGDALLLEDAFESLKWDGDNS